MKVLVLLCSHEMNSRWAENIIILNNYFQEQKIHVDYCGISNQNDFHHYEQIISFAYKVINPKFQLSKVCDFFAEHKIKLNSTYTWFVKIRPDVKLLEPIPFEACSESAVNARARSYYGPLQIKFGMSVNGVGRFKDIGDCSIEDTEHDVILDDMFFVLHHSIIERTEFGSADQFTYLDGNTLKQCEHIHCEYWAKQNIPLNVIGIHVENTKYNVFSGNLNC